MAGRCVTLCRYTGSARVVSQPLGLGPLDPGPDEVDVPPDLVCGEEAQALGESVVEPGAGDLPGRDDHRDAQLLGEGADLPFNGGVDGTIHAPRMTPGGRSE